MPRACCFVDIKITVLYCKSCNVNKDKMYGNLARPSKMLISSVNVFKHIVYVSLDASSGMSQLCYVTMTPKGCV